MALERSLSSCFAPISMLDQVDLFLLLKIPYCRAVLSTPILSILRPLKHRPLNLRFPTLRHPTLRQLISVQSNLPPFSPFSLTFLSAAIPTAIHSLHLRRGQHQSCCDGRLYDLGCA